MIPLRQSNCSHTRSMLPKACAHPAVDLRPERACAVIRVAQELWRRADHEQQQRKAGQSASTINEFRLFKIGLAGEGGQGLRLNSR